MPKAQQLVGKRFSRLSVISKVGRRSGKVFWGCECDCGKKVEVYTGVLNSGRVKSCGCWTRDRLRETNTLPFGFAARNIILSTYKANAVSRGLRWELTDEAFMRITASDCHYCGIPPSNYFTHRRKDGTEKLNGGIRYNGIDRVDNNMGYLEENCVPCCDICNKAKRAMPYDEFMNWINRLSEHQSKRNAITLAAGS